MNGKHEHFGIFVTSKPDNTTDETHPPASTNNPKLFSDNYEIEELDKFNIEINKKKQSFEKTVLSLFYKQDKERLIKIYFTKTIFNFQKMETKILELIKQQN